ncbi:hypothetical protein BT69DRAFT_1315217 [Atractiella rhizophila]|nr:hypothetical protein BT69DRAFT_1315217 [Atractiella rhizophila]
MDDTTSSLHDTLDAMSDSLSALESALDDVLSPASIEELEKSPLLVQAKQSVTMAYTVYDLVFVYLKLKGIDPSTHPVQNELGTVKAYFTKVQKAGEKEEKRTTRVDKEAADRFIRHAISQASAPTSSPTITGQESGISSLPPASTGKATTVTAQASTSSSLPKPITTDPLIGYKDTSKKKRKREGEPSKNALKKAKRRMEAHLSSSADNSQQTSELEIEVEAPADTLADERTEADVQMERLPIEAGGEEGVVDVPDAKLGVEEDMEREEGQPKKKKRRKNKARASTSNSTPQSANISQPQSQSQSQSENVEGKEETTKMSKRERKKLRKAQQALLREGAEGQGVASASPIDQSNGAATGSGENGKKKKGAKSVAGTKEEPLLID